MIRIPTLVGAAALCATVLSAGTADAAVIANTKWLNTKWLNTKWLNTKWLNTADLNASNGGASFYNPSTGQTLPQVTLDRTTFVSSSWVCNGTQICHVEEKRGDAFIGTWTSATLNDGTPSYTYIAGRYHPVSADADTYLYTIYAWAQASNGSWGWLSPCVDEAGNAVPAIPLAGQWDMQTGARISNTSNKFTWACTNGAIGKCAASGIPNTLAYSPWRQDWYYQLDANNNVVSVDGQRTHQACTRMIRADYCGDGTSRTADGTPIDVRDHFLGGQRDEATSWPAEAVWSETGARWVSCQRLAWLPGGVLRCPGHYFIDNTANGKMCLPINFLPWPPDLQAQQSGIMANLPPRAGELLLGNRTSNLRSTP